MSQVFLGFSKIREGSESSNFWMGSMTTFTDKNELIVIRLPISKFIVCLLGKLEVCLYSKNSFLSMN